MEPTTDPQAMSSCNIDDETSPTTEYQTTQGETVTCTEDIYFLHRTSPDLTQLPKEILVKIVSYLSLYDRYILSQTCQVLYDTLNHPSLWHTMVISENGCSDNKYRRNRLAPFHFVYKFGKFFKHLILTNSDEGFPEEWVSIMSELGQQCRSLDSLVLNIGRPTNFDLFDYQPSEKDLQVVLSFVHHAFRLRQLNLDVWPLYLKNEDLNIFSVILQNPKLKGLEILKLFWCESTGWPQRRPILPSPEDTLQLVKQFRNLTQLSLRSPMLDTNIIQALSCPTRSKLKLLQIFINFVEGDRIYKIPEISSQLWQQFSVANEDVSVECNVFSRTPYSELASMLKPECALSTIAFMRISSCDPQMLISLTDMYHQRLKRFACYCEHSSTNENDIVLLVRRCQQLDHLVYYGFLSCPAVEKIAKLRGPQWKELRISEKHIIARNALPNDDDDDDYSCAAKFYDECHDECTRLHGLIERVSAALQRNWKPIDVFYDDHYHYSNHYF